MNVIIEPPWYRQFWPWFLLCLLMSVVIASLVTLNIAMSDPDGPVVGSMASGNKKISVGGDHGLGQATVTADFDSGLLLINLVNDPTADTLQLTLLHPTRAARDIDLQLSRISNLEWVAELPSVITTRSQNWQWLLATADQQQSGQGYLINSALDHQQD